MFDKFIAALVPAAGEFLLDLLSQIGWQRDLHGWSPLFILRFGDPRGCGGIEVDVIQQEGMRGGVYEFTVRGEGGGEDRQTVSCKRGRVDRGG
jgi:hypothetical protein